MLWQDSSGSSVSQSCTWHPCPGQPSDYSCLIQGVSKKTTSVFMLWVSLKVGYSSYIRSPNAPSNPLSKVFPLSSFEVLKCEWTLYRATAKCHQAGLPPSSHPAPTSRGDKPGQRRSVRCLPLTLPVEMAGKPPYPWVTGNPFSYGHTVSFVPSSAAIALTEVFFVANPQPLHRLAVCLVQAAVPRGM